MTGTGYTLRNGDIAGDVASFRPEARWRRCAASDWDVVDGTQLPTGGMESGACVRNEGTGGDRVEGRTVVVGFGIELTGSAGPVTGAPAGL